MMQQQRSPNNKCASSKQAQTTDDNNNNNNNNNTVRNAKILGGGLTQKFLEAAAASSSNGTSQPLQLPPANQQKGVILRTPPLTKASSHQFLLPPPPTSPHQQQQQAQQQQQQQQLQQQETSDQEVEELTKPVAKLDLSGCQQLANSRQLDEDDYDSRYDLPMVETSLNRDFNKGSQEGSLYGCGGGGQTEPKCIMVTPASPKAKSAPATPCNLTPTAFQQHNTLPPDIRKNISATCRVLAGPSSGSSRETVHYWIELIRRGEASLAAKDFASAERFFSECIEQATGSKNLAFLKANFKVFCQRAEANLQLANYNAAIADSIEARHCNPKWSQAYYLQGRAQFLLGQHVDCLAVFAFGLREEPQSKKLFEAFVEVFKLKFEDTFRQLSEHGLDRKPFVVVSMLGQELLARGSLEHAAHAAIILESALKMGASESKKFKSSVLSTISLAYCLRKDYERAIPFMQRELELESELEDAAGQCRALGNLGHAHYKLRKFDRSLEEHRRQVTVAMRSQLYTEAALALSAMGHVHVARNDLTSALTSHSRCLEILRQLRNTEFAQLRQLAAIGHIHSLLSDFKAAGERLLEARQLLEPGAKLSQDEYQLGAVMLNFNLAYLELKKHSFANAKDHYTRVLQLAESLPQPKGDQYKMRASNGLGQVYRMLKDYDNAKSCFDKQLRFAEKLKDGAGLSQALCNLGLTYQLFKDYANARSYFSDNLKLVEQLGAPLLKAYALSYIGSMHFIANRFAEAQKNYEDSLKIFRELDYCAAEQRTIDLNMAAVSERLAASAGNAGALGAGNAQSSQIGADQLATPNHLGTQHKKVLMA